MLQINEELIEGFTNLCNRSKGQTNFLFDLCDGDLQKLAMLEERIKNNFIWYCPGDKEEVERIMKLPNKGYYTLFKSK